MTTIFKTILFLILAGFVKMLMVLSDLFEKKLVTYKIYTEKIKNNLPFSLTVAQKMNGLQRLFLRRN